MNVKERAKIFAINAHNGQIRKTEPDKPLIIHSFEVANILESYKLDDSVVAAGYLHDVVEDTKYTSEDIVEKFGIEIANLVLCASEPDKSLSWGERKIHTIQTIKELPLRNKLLVCADKISNLESLINLFNKTGERDFSAFKRGEKKQKWYYTSVYESLVVNEDENHPMFKRLKDDIDILFNGKEDTYLKDVIFEDKLERYERLKSLHAQKEEIKKISRLVKLPKPYVIEFAGTMRTGKTTLIKVLEDFLKKGGFKVKVIEEFTTSKYFKEVFREKNKNLQGFEYYLEIVEEVKRQLEQSLLEDYDFILIDRSLNDRQIWNYRGCMKLNVPEDVYVKAKEKYLEISKSLIDCLVATYARPITALRRDYECNIALEERSFINYKNICEYNEAFKALENTFNESVSKFIFFDTTFVSMNDVVFDIVSSILQHVRETYLEALKKEVNQYVSKTIC